MTEVRVPDDAGKTARMCDVGGYIVPIFWKSPEEIKQNFDQLSNFKSKDGDVILCTYPKTGTNWLYEVIMMILNKSSEPVKQNKLETMFEVTPLSLVDAVASPRVLNSHLPPRYMPTGEMKRKKVKTVLCVRNPKDAAVSYYHHMFGLKIYDYTGQWKNWIGPFLRGEFEYGTYTSYLNEWQSVVEDEDRSYPLHVLYFEDLKKDGPTEVTRLAEFLGVELSDKLRDGIVHSSGFDEMKKNTADKFDIFREGFSLLRKGQIGGWKTELSVAQNEMFHAVWDKEIRQDTMFKFKFT